jgi:hypothetical protein
MLPVILDQNFKNQDYTKIALPKAEYDNCIFKDCKIIGMPFYECNPFLFTTNFKNLILI